MEPNCSRMPTGCEAAIPRAQAVCFSARPRTLDWGAGCSIFTPASAASTDSCLAAPTAQPAQLRKVRCASWSTASLHPRDGCVATNFARICVIGGALGSASTFVLRAIRLKDSSVGVAEDDAHLVFTGEAEGE